MRFRSNYFTAKIGEPSFLALLETVACSCFLVYAVTSLNWFWYCFCAVFLPFGLIQNSQSWGLLSQWWIRVEWYYRWVLLNGLRRLNLWARKHQRIAPKKAIVANLESNVPSQIERRLPNWAVLRFGNSCCL